MLYPGMVQAMRVLCVRDKKTVPFYPVFISLAHPLLHQPATPLSVALGVPLVVRKEGLASVHLPDGSGNANLIATFLNIELDSGIAPVFEWQDDIGNVLVVRKDGESARFLLL
jgi:hypothetical protein